ncbi:hypothetical protein, partial [Ferrimicrobium acidiphilum]
RLAPCSPNSPMFRSTLQRATWIPSRLRAWAHLLGSIDRIVLGVDTADGTLELDIALGSS